MKVYCVQEIFQYKLVKVFDTKAKAKDWVLSMRWEEEDYFITEMEVS